KLFVNLPVKDLKRSMELFTTLGYTFNPQFTDDNAACLIIGEDNYAMLLSEPYFKTFTPKAIADAGKTTEVLVAVSLKSREEVDRQVKLAVSVGAKPHREPVDHGFMYQWGFEDYDGHIWEL